MRRCNQALGPACVQQLAARGVSSPAPPAPLPGAVRLIWVATPLPSQLAEVSADGTAAPAAAGVERFVLVLKGAITVRHGRNDVELSANSYVYFPPNSTNKLSSESGAGLLIYERVYAAGGNPVFRCSSALLSTARPPSLQPAAAVQRRPAHSARQIPHPYVKRVGLCLTACACAWLARRAAMAMLRSRRCCPRGPRFSACASCCRRYVAQSLGSCKQGNAYRPI
jgi:hypothetical protein